MSILLKCPNGHERKIPDDFPRDRASCNFCDHVFDVERAREAAEAAAAPRPRPVVGARPANPKYRPPPAAGAPVAAAPDAPPQPMLSGWSGMAIVFGGLLLAMLGVPLLLAGGSSAPRFAAPAERPKSWPAFRDALIKMPPDMARCEINESIPKVWWTFDATIWKRLSTDEKKDTIHAFAYTTKQAAADHLGSAIHIEFRNSMGREIAEYSIWTGEATLK